MTDRTELRATTAVDKTADRKDTRTAPLNDLAAAIYGNARDRGFWEVERNMGEMLMLAVSELSEALEEHRAERPPVWYQHRQPCAVQSDGLPIPADELGPCSGAPVCKPEGVAVELADCLIRCLDTMHSLGVDIDAVVAEKMAYNAARPFKHGKAY